MKLLLIALSTMFFMSCNIYLMTIEDWNVSVKDSGIQYRTKRRYTRSLV
jgi:hypothetical protein